MMSTHPLALEILLTQREDSNDETLRAEEDCHYCE